ncbi:ABC transporter permease [Algoriphagus zhangzhouensis]|uniref:ABC-2 type transport system permease protein n=1 Tax=Algoriphagus zhangzhouensis TaxID=1073327 RepID=A0A1M7ZIH3_9BACT|nr:ABC transporter permease [Algoriphagus zhangzhouensis]TDY43782.1 ABC-2 type transport system permease protein [Algoriphagus zhangzhouensis]SHO64677.1 ABC-2 type transport system permease protein [Algoriphagus zhangzhouensis]
MNKIWLVMQREYLARVKKKSFLLATLLTPLIFPAIMAIFVWIAVEEKDNQSLRIIEVVDENKLFFLESSDQYAFSFSDRSDEEAKELVKNGDRYGFLHIPNFDLEDPKGITFFGEENPNMNLMSYLESSLKKKIEDQRLYESGIDPQLISDIRTNVDIKSITVNEQGEEKVSNATVNYAIGFVAGILIYMFIFIYGNQIMQGVIEEKSSRIVEILVSSLKPFQLMMGKIVGIAGVGLTQLLIWIVLIGGLTTIVTGYLGMKMPQQQAMEMAQVGMEQIPDSGVSEILQVINGIDFVTLVLCFVFYFLGGYLLYGALFAGIGSAVDAPSDAQQFMLPVTIPLIVSYMGLFVFVLQDPNSTASFWLSIVPLTSPIAMMGRVSFGVPFWELALSMVLLILGFLGTTWLAGKIYRIGILMHGTKPSYKTLWKWIKTNN